MLAIQGATTTGWAARCRWRTECQWVGIEQCSLGRALGLEERHQPRWCAHATIQHGTQPLKLPDDHPFKKQNQDNPFFNQAGAS